MTIAVYGAAGFTGRLVAAELLRRGIPMVLAGRNAERLSRAAAEAGAADAELRVASVEDEDALAAAFRGCDAVINCVAPFVHWGEPVVRAAIAAGVHYTDISGEQDYIKRIFDTYARSAEHADVSVVPMVNDGGFLTDLLASLTSRGVADAADIVTAHRLSGAGMSRGSARTALANAASFADGGLAFSGGQWRRDITPQSRSVTFPGSTDPSPVVRLPAGEVVTIPRHVEARHVEAVIDAEFAARFGAMTAAQAEAMPDGPTQDRRRGERFLLVADIAGPRHRARGVIEGIDIYGTTAVAVVEAAKRLTAARVKPGVLAPAQAFDAADFIGALAAHGIRCTVDGRPIPQ